MCGSVPARSSSESGRPSPSVSALLGSVPFSRSRASLIPSPSLSGPSVTGSRRLSSPHGDWAILQMAPRTPSATLAPTSEVTTAAMIAATRRSTPMYSAAV